MLKLTPASDHNLMCMETVTRKEAELLTFLAEYQILLNEQIAILTCTGLRAAQKKISKLYHKGLIGISQRPLNGNKGRPEYVYTFSLKGTAFLRNQNLISHSFSEKHSTINVIENIEHDILTNWFRIHLSKIDKQIPNLHTEFIPQYSHLLPTRKNGLPLISENFLVNDQQVQFIPDGVFSIFSKKQNKRLLFFLETDMSTEPITSSNPQSTTISQKILNYITYFLNNGYKRYEKKWNCTFNGFRCLFFTNTPVRARTIRKYVIDQNAREIFWITDQKSVFTHGITAAIWNRGGNTQIPHQSILGSSLTNDLA